MTIHPVPRMFVSVLALWALITLITAPMVTSAQVSLAIPSDIDTSSRYFFFLHNYYVEVNGPDGDCKYHDLLKAFIDDGFVVISEIRKGKIVPCSYAQKVVEQVNELLAAEVPPQNITIAGHSKGGVIALCVASQLQNKELNFVIMAGCEIAGIKKHDMYPDFTKVKGRILSMYAESDTVAGSCSQAFSLSAGGLTDTELELDSGKGHQLFFGPDTVWLTPMSEWLNEIK